MKKEEVERPVPFDHVFRLFLVLLGPCPQILGARLVSHQRVLKGLIDALTTRSDTRPLTHAAPKRGTTRGRKSYSHCTSHEQSATSHDVSNAYKGGTVHIERNTNNRKLQVLLFVFVTAV